MRDDALVLVRVVPGDDRDRRLGLAQVHRLVRDAGRDEQEVAGLRDDRLLEAVAVARLDAALELVDRGLVAVVVVRLGRRPGRHDDEVHRQPGRPAGLGGHAEEVAELLAPDGSARRPITRNSLTATA